MTGVVAAGCTGKQPFASRDQALRVLKRTNQHLTFFGHYAMVWMLTNNTKRNRKK